MASDDNMFGEESEKHQVRNGIMLFAMCYLVVRLFETGVLTRIGLVLLGLAVYAAIQDVSTPLPPGTTWAPATLINLNPYNHN